MVSQRQRLPTQPPPPYSDTPPVLSSVVSAPPVLAQRAASVASARSSNRRHRHARTHYGGSTANTAQNEFPIFAHTGDVEVVITTADGRKENRYLLHRLILSQCSGVFEAGTRAEWSGQQRATLPSIREGKSSELEAGSSSTTSSHERRPSFEQPRNRWRYVLDWEHTAEDEAPMLVQGERQQDSIFGARAMSSAHSASARHKPAASVENLFQGRTNFSALNVDERHTQPNSSTGPGEEILKDYDNLFRTMYQYPPVLDSVNIANAYTECKALLNLADMYDALDIVGNRVDHHLLRFGARLLKQIAKYPPSYLKLGYLSRSRTIFTEALIHVVGQWPAAAPQLRNQVDEGVMDIILDKVDELAEQQERVEFKLWRLSLTTSRGERVTYSNDYLSWLAMSLFRQWLADSTSPAAESSDHLASVPSQSRGSNRSSNHIASQRVPQPNRSPPALAPQQQPPGRVYRVLGSTASTAYLGHEELKRFLKLQPELYTRENLRKLERRMDNIKALAREAVKPLMSNFLELDLSAFGPAGLGYLTCVKIEQRDVPWD